MCMDNLWADIWANGPQGSDKGYEDQLKNLINPIKPHCIIFDAQNYKASI